jgi:hypothetical protein
LFQKLSQEEMDLFFSARKTKMNFFFSLLGCSASTPQELDRTVKRRKQIYRARTDFSALQVKLSLKLINRLRVSVRWRLIGS